MMKHILESAKDRYFDRKLIRHFIGARKEPRNKRVDKLTAVFLDKAGSA